MAHSPKHNRLDWLTTARQTIPRLRNVLTHLQPTFHLNDVRGIDSAFLTSQGIRGLIWDVDGTLTNYHGMEIAPELAPHMSALFATDTLRHAILSNCDERRFEELKSVFPHTPLIRGYHTKDGTVFRTATGQTDSHSVDQVNDLLDAGGQQIRKPSGELIEHATAVLDIPPAECVMVGDQYFTDIASANLGAIRSIKVQTFGKKTFPRSIQTTQKLEPVIYRLFGGRRRR